MQKKLPLKAFVFDIMYLDGKSLVDTSLTERMRFLATVIDGDEVLIKQPRAGIIGPQLHNPDGTLQPSVRTFPSVLTLAVLLLKLPESALNTFQSLNVPAKFHLRLIF